MHVNKYVPFYLQVHKLKKQDIYRFEEDYQEGLVSQTDKTLQEVYDKFKVSRLIEFDQALIKVYN